MEKILNENGKCGGVYKITNILNDKIYIGSARMFYERAVRHENMLKNGTHPNKHLLSSWKKYGDGNFVFEILYIVYGNEKERKAIEQEYIEKYYDKWDRCYNIAKKTTISEHAWSLNPEETKKKMSDKAKESWKNPVIRKRRCRSIRRFAKTKEFKDKISKIVKDSWKNPETRKKRIRGIINTVAKSYYLISPDGDELTITNLQQFCKDRSLSQRSMRKVISGDRVSHKGWKIKNGRIDPRFKTYTLVNPDNVKITIINLRKFCLDNNLDYSGMQSVVYKRRMSFAGYKLPV